MSKTTKQEAQMFAEDVRRRERRQHFQAPVWQTLSFILHGLGFVALVLFTPLREIVIPEKKEAKSDPNMTADRIEELSESIQTVRLNELMEQLNALQIILHNMDTMKNEILEDYDSFAEHEQPKAKESVKALFDKIIEEQEKTIAEQKNTLNAVDEITKLQIQNIADENTTQKMEQTLDAVRPSFPAIDDAQANAQNLLDKVAVESQLVGMAKTAEASEVLRDVQLNANTMQREFQKNLEGKVSAVASYPKLLVKIPEQKAALEKTKATYKNTLEHIARVKADSVNGFKAADVLEKEVAQRKADLEKARQEAEKEREAYLAKDKTVGAVREALAKAAREKAAADAAVRDAEALANNAKAEKARKKAGADALKESLGKAEKNAETATAAAVKSEESAKALKAEIALAAKENLDDKMNAQLRDREAAAVAKQMKDAAAVAEQSAKLDAATKANADAVAKMEEAKAKEEAALAELAKKTEAAKALAARHNELAQSEKMTVQSVLESKERDKSSSQKVRGAESELLRKTKELQEVKRLAESNAKTAERETAWAERLKAEVETAQESIKSSEQRKTEIAKLAKTSVAVVKQAQKDAITAQEELVKKVAEVAKLAEIEEAKLVKLSKENFQPDPISYQELSTLDIVEAYDAAKQLETKITESYRDIKAAEVAMLRKMSYQAASKITDVAKVVRADLDKDVITTPPRDKAAFDKQKEEAMNAVREADNMVETTKMLMTAAVEIVRPETLGKGKKESAEDRLQRMYDLSGLSAEMTAAAAENSDEQAKDLSKLMAQAMSDGSATHQEGNTKTSSEGTTLLVPSSALRSPLPAGLSGLSSQMPELAPGNVIKLEGNADNPFDGVPAKWMYVNSWYVIGPFPNPDRVNIRRKFAPESVVDLDATYVGKSDRPVKWQFEQARSSLRWQESRALVIPTSSEEYGIWYACSDVFVDKECDLWIAVGSDDRSDLWLNDMHVWGSSNELKSWRINEGFRKVHFQKGRNRFLARVENGWHAISWSVCIALTDDVSI